MGNSNSSSGHRANHHHPHGHPHGHHPQHEHPHNRHDQWSHSLETPEQRNRMKRGYFPPRPFVGLPPPHKVLPHSAVPTKLLKATSNGAILHGGGTISGRKLAELDLEIRKRSTASCPVNNDLGLSSGRSTPNLIRPRKGGSSKSSREYESEPDLREVGLAEDHGEGTDSLENRSVSPLPNSFTLISESPAKKQIRSRKKSKAPPPPGHPRHEPVILIPYTNGHHQPPPGALNLMQHPHSRQIILTPEHFMASPSQSSQGKKKLNRLFKTKAESKSAAASPALRSPSGSELMMMSMSPQSHNFQNGQNIPRGGPMRASLDANRLIRGDKDRMSHHSVEGGLENSSSSKTQMSSSSHPIDRESKAEGLKFGNAANPNQKNNPITNARLGSSSGPLCSPKGGRTAEVTNLNLSKKQQSLSHAQQSPLPSSRDGSSGLRQVPKNNKSSQEIHTKSATTATTPTSNNNKTKGLVSSNVSNEHEKKKFYFGMDIGTFSSKKQIAASGGSPTPRKPEELVPTSKDSSGDFSVTGNLHKEVSRRKMIKQLEESDPQNQRSSSRTDNEFNDEITRGASPKGINEQSGNSAHQNQPNHGNKSHNMNHSNGGKVMSQTHNANHGNIINNKPLLNKSNSNNRSESDSDGLHRRQDSGSFELNDANTRKASRNNAKVSGVIRESSSDLSSSDLDVPLVVTRPTLPQKRPDLPRFSPTAAWRALDSPSRVSISGRSFSSEEGHGADRITRYTRPSAPPRVSNERSGDSGISAGDAGSPANRMPSDTIMDMSSSPVMMNMNSRGYKSNRPSNNNIVQSPKDHLLSADRMMKCWTPEQDLDESSSDFEHDNILPPVPPPVQSQLSPSQGNTKIVGNKVGGNKAVPVGLRTPPKFTTRSNLFEGKRAAAVVSDSDSKYFSAGGGDEGGNSNNPRRLYSRSAKSKNQNQQAEGNINNMAIVSNPSKKRFNYPQNSPNNNSRYLNHGKYSNNNFSNSPIVMTKRKGLKHQQDNNNDNGFVGLDTNWFLSRSEPNSLHHLGIVGDGSGVGSGDMRLASADEEFLHQDQLRRQRDAQLLAKVFPPRKARAAANGSANQNANKLPPTSNAGREVIVGSRKRMPKNEQDDDELECELHLEDEEDSSSDNNNIITQSSNNGNAGNGGGRRVNRNGNKKEVQLRSEIGYGPSSMNFYTTNNNPTTPPTAKGTRANPNQPYYDDYEPETDQIHPEDDLEEEEELMRDDLFDYLDQYEEGEFEREQELTTSASDKNHQPGNNIPNNNNNGNMKSPQTSSKNNRPFSHHIMYLPSYDSRRVHSTSGNNWRRARSVDHLDTSESTLFRRHRSPQQGGYFDVESEDNSRNRSNFRKQNVNSANNKGPPSSRRIERLDQQERHQHQQQTRKSSEPCYPSSGNRSRSVPPYTEEDEIHLEHQESSKHNPMTPDSAMNDSSLEEQERRLLNKKKFKFQSTLRVKERQKIEQELTREARQREEERLRETEAMKKVEEEFQKKRAKEKLEAQAATALANLNGKDELPIMTSRNEQNSKMSSNQGRKISSNNYQGAMSPQGRNVLSHQPSTSSAASSGITSMGQSHHSYHNQKQNHHQQQGHRRSGPGGMSKRQEPEGAPASVDMNSMCNSSGNVDLRKELISASKKRNANTSIIGGSNQELTQELSEFRQETRQYCDYRRAPRQQSLSPARFAKSSSSDIFPISSRRKGGSSYSGASKASGRSTVHPEVICDIPSKPHPYMVNASRLSGSNVNLVSEERPNSGLGSTNNLSSPSSVISDNYRKDWAHHYRGSGGSILQGGRASSVISLHSAPGYSSSDNFRNSTSDLSRAHPNHGPSDLPSPRFLRDRGNRLTRQYSTSPPSTSPQPRGSSNDSTATESIHPMESSRASPVRITSRSHTTVISIGAPMPKSDPFQAQPFNKVKGYRPVAFKPPPVTSTAVN